jgi:hypothetical protein
MAAVAGLISSQSARGTVAVEMEDRRRQELRASAIFHAYLGAMMAGAAPQSVNFATTPLGIRTSRSTWPPTALAYHRSAFVPDPEGALSKCQWWQELKPPTFEKLVESVLSDLDCWQNEGLAPFSGQVLTAAETPRNQPRFIEYRLRRI